MAVTGGGHRLAAAAPVPVHVARGWGAGAALSHLRASTDVCLATSPRHATVLVVAGAVPVSHLGSLAGVHDQVPRPRAVAVIGPGGDDATAFGLGPVTRLPDDDVTGSLCRLHDDVLAGRVDHPPLGRADHPVDWQGLGPHGQGGEGMMGGTPYGRPMAMPPTEGRDGLSLDRLALRLGPFLPALPAGLTVDVGLQGDVLAEVTLRMARPAEGWAGGPVGDPRAGPARVAGRWLDVLADLCALAGLQALARRAARVALDPTPGAIADLGRRLDRPWALRAATDGVGRLPDGTDATDRWRAWLVAAEAAARGEGDPPHVLARSTDEVADALVGAELGRARLTLASLQPDLEPALPVPVDAA